MGFENEDVDILERRRPRRKNSMSSILYKQAGNLVVVDVLYSIVKPSQDEIELDKIL